jgi:hypothetical protein
MAYFAEAADGRWDRLRVLDLSNCIVGDIGLSQLAAAVQAGFGRGLEEIDVSCKAVWCVQDTSGSCDQYQ